jgi:hypothetical protein
MNLNRIWSVAGIVVGLAMVLSLAGASTVSALTASDIDLLAAMGLIPADKVAAAKAVLGTSATVTTSSTNFAKDLTVGSRGADVTALQNLLGISPATGYFGALTKAAVIKYQLAQGISPAAGYVGAKTRGVLNASAGTTTGGTTGTTVNVSGTDLKVSLAASSPISGAIVAGQAAAGLADFTFTNTSATPAVVTNVTLARGGVSADTTLSNVYLYNGATRLTDAATVSSGKITFNASAGLLTVPAGSSVVISVKADILAGTSGQLVSVSLTGVTSNVPVSAVYPISGSAQNVFSSSDIAIATSTLSAGTLSAGTLQAGSLNQSLWSSSLNISGRAVYLKSLAVKVIGSIPSDALQNLNLFVSGVKVGSAYGVDSNGMVTFDLSGAPYKIDSLRTIEVRADVVKGSSRTFTLSLQNASDLQIIDSNYNVGLAVNLSGAQSSGTWTVNGTSGGSVTVTLDNTLSAGDVITGAPNVPMARYTLKAYGEDMKISYLQASSTDALDNVALYANGIQIGSTQTITAVGTGKLYNIGSSLIIPAGQSVTVEIRADIKASGVNLLTTGNSINVALAGYSNNAQGKESSQLTTVPASITVGILGPTMTVKSASVTLSTNGSYSASQTVVPNSSNVKLGSYTIQAGSAEPIRFTSMTVTLGGAAGATTNVSNLTVSIPGSAAVSPISPNATNNFTVDFTVPANGSQTVDVYGDISSVEDVATTTLALSGYGVNSNVTVTKTAVTGQTITAGTGSLAVPTLKSGSGYSPTSQYVVGNSTYTAGVYNFVSTNGLSTISELYFDAAGTAANIVSVTAGGVTVPMVSASSSLTGLNIAIPVGNAGVNVPVVVQYANVGTNGVTTANTTGLTLTGYKYTSGNTTTSTTTVSRSTNLMTLVASKPTVAFVDVSKTSGSGVREIARVTVSADAKGPITLKTLPLTMQASGSGSAAASTGMTVQVNGSNITAAFSAMGAVGTTTATTTSITFNSGDGYDIAAGSSVTFSIYDTVSLSASGDAISTSLGATSTFSWVDTMGSTTQALDGQLIYNFPSTGVSMLSY